MEEIEKLIPIVDGLVYFIDNFDEIRDIVYDYKAVQMHKELLRQAYGEGEQ